jgi:hypothetical protein
MGANRHQGSVEVRQKQEAIRRQQAFGNIIPGSEQMAGFLSAPSANLPAASLVYSCALPMAFGQAFSFLATGNRAVRDASHCGRKGQGTRIWPS